MSSAISDASLENSGPEHSELPQTVGQPEPQADGPADVPAGTSDEGPPLAPSAGAPAVTEQENGEASPTFETPLQPHPALKVEDSWEVETLKIEDSWAVENGPGQGETHVQLAQPAAAPAVEPAVVPEPPVHAGTDGPERRPQDETVTQSGAEDGSGPEASIVVPSQLARESIAEAHDAVAPEDSADVQRDATGRTGDTGDESGTVVHPEHANPSSPRPLTAWSPTSAGSGALEENARNGDDSPPGVDGRADAPVEAPAPSAAHAPTADRTPLRARLHEAEPSAPLRRDSAHWAPFDAEHGARDAEPQDTLSVVLRRKGTVALVALVTALTAFAASHVQTPVYQSSAELLLQSRRSEQIFAPESPAAEVNRFRIATELQVMKSRSVRDRVTEELGREPKVTIRAVGETDVISITAQSTSATEAARIVNTYAETYITTRRQQVIDDLFAAGAQVQAKMAEVDQQLRTLDGPIADLEAQIAAVEGRLTGTDSAAIRQATADRARLGQEIAVKRREADSLRAQRDTYDQQLDQLQLASNLTQTGGAQIVSRAVVPTSPVSPKPVRNGVIALFIGMMLGVGAAILRDRSDNTVRTEADLVEASGGLTVLASIPSVPGWRRRSSTRVVSLTAPKSRSAEAYRALRTSLQFGAGLALNAQPQVIQVTSAGSGEGKSTTAANLAVALALTGQRVTMVCCDLRRPRLHDFFGLTNTVGISSVVLGQVPLSAAIQTVGFDGRLTLLSSGPAPSNPSELLSSQRAAELLRSLAEHNDVVILDSAPVLPVTDSVVLARAVDRTILVVRANKTTRSQVRRAVARLRHVDAPIVGTVLNQFDTESAEAGGYYDSAPTTRGRPWRARNGNGHNGSIDPAAETPGVGVEHQNQEPAPQ